MRKRFTVPIMLAAVMALVMISPGFGPAGAQKNAKIDPNARLEFGMNMGGGGFSQRLQPDGEHGDLRRRSSATRSSAR